MGTVLERVRGTPARLEDLKPRQWPEDFSTDLEVGKDRAAGPLGLSHLVFDTDLFSFGILKKIVSQLNRRPLT